MTNFVVKLRGLPWVCSAEEVLKFLDPVEVKNGSDGIHFRKNSGEALVELNCEEDIEEAVKKDHEHIGHRYIEVFHAKSHELDNFIESKNSKIGDCIVKLRGLPYNTSKEEVFKFFSGLDIVPNGICIITDYMGRTSGEAFVEFSTSSVAEKAKERHKEMIGKRYIEVFPSNSEHRRHVIQQSQNMPSDGNWGPQNNFGRPFMGEGPNGNFGPMGNNNFGPMMGNGQNNRMMPYDIRSRPAKMMNRDRKSKPKFPTNSVHMRGLPWRATEFELYEFFKPLETKSVKMGTDTEGRPSGEADVEFHSHSDCLRAMKKDRQRIKHRYIELFLHSSPAEGEEDLEEENWGGNMGGGGGGNNMGGGNMGNMTQMEMVQMVMSNMMGNGNMTEMISNMMGNFSGGNMGYNNNQGNMGFNNQGNMGFNNQGNMGFNNQCNMGYNNQGNMGYNNQGNMGYNNQGNMGYNNNMSGSQKMRPKPMGDRNQGGYDQNNYNSWGSGY